MEPPKCPAAEPAKCQQSIWDTNLEAGRRRDEPGKENVELKNCIALVVIYLRVLHCAPEGRLGA